ncbi:MULTISPECIES: cupredoxin domain-containing protein [Methanosarcina]|nr:cupredoxin domain-containing protein [Methanosarcina barkeri]
MGKRMRTGLILLMVLFSIFLAIGCTSKGETYYVKIENSQFYPNSITMYSSDTVRWTNLDPTNHTVVGTGFSSGNIASQDSYDHKFTKIGTYNYYCSIEPSMKGVIIVK